MGIKKRNFFFINCHRHRYRDTDMSHIPLWLYCTVAKKENLNKKKKDVIIPRCALTFAYNCMLFFCFFPLKPLFLLFSLNRKPELLKGVYNMGFNRPSRIQENALPMMLAQPWVALSLSSWNAHLSLRGQACSCRVCPQNSPAHVLKKVSSSNTRWKIMTK